MFDPTEVIAELEARRNDIDATIDVFRRLYGVPIKAAPEDIPPDSKTRQRYMRRALAQKPAVPRDYKHPGRSSPVQDAILKVLTPHTPMTSLEIVEKLQKGDVKTTAGSVYATVAALLAKGLVARVKNDEGRVAWTLVIKP